MKRIVLITLLVIASVFMIFSFKYKGKAHKADRANKLYEQGVKKIDKKDYKGAVELFTQVIELNPKHDQAYEKRGSIKTEFFAQHKDAILDLDKAIKLNPKEAIAYHNRGLAKIKLNDLEGAIKDLSQAIKIAPTYYVAHNSRGAAYGMLGKYEEAIKDFESTIIIKPDYLNAHLNKIYAYIKMNKPDKAMETANQAKEAFKKEKGSQDYKRLEQMIEFVKKSNKVESVKIIRPKNGK